MFPFSLSGISSPLMAVILMAALPFIMELGPTEYNKIVDKRSISYRVIDMDITAGELYDAMSVVKGQDSAKDQLVEIISGWTESKKNPKVKTGGLIIHIAGPPGTGKSLIANRLACVLLRVPVDSHGKEKEKVPSVSYASVDPLDPKLSAAEQIFGEGQQFYGRLIASKNSPTAAQVKYNPNTVIQIHEFDKISKEDKNGRCTSLLEYKLWDVVDDGIISLNGQPYDCSNTIFIITSNSSKKSIGLDSPNSGQIGKDQSTETVFYRQAFLDRIHNVYFDDLRLEDYAEIVETRLNLILEDYNKQLEKFDLLLTLGKETVIKIARELVNTKVGGARNCKKIINKVYFKLAKFKNENLAKLEEEYSKLEGEESSESEASETEAEESLETELAEPKKIILDYSEELRDFLIIEN